MWRAKMTNRREFMVQATIAGTAAYTLSPGISQGAMTSGRDNRPHKCVDVNIPMKDVEGKVAFITGGDSGIGLGIARAFADAGMKVVISYRTKSHLDEAMKSLESAGNRLHAINVDVTDRPGMEQAAAETTNVFGKVHVLVNNAGVQFTPTLGNTGYEDWDRMIAVNVTGVFNGVHAFLPSIKEHGEGGQIIATASAFGLVYLVAQPGGYGAYCAAKFAVVGMMEALRVELAGNGIGVSAFCPGMVKSNLEPWLKSEPTASDPLEVGRLVLRGMRNNDLYILTHPEFAELLRERNDVLVASMPRDVHLSDQRMSDGRKMAEDSLYAVELTRIQCAKSPYR
jgi:NAD(P)-dependent dehydrogenase (short-subunit alcohol dehydrogenase family)